jgi:hypothetical protein
MRIHGTAASEWLIVGIINQLNQQDLCSVYIIYTDLTKNNFFINLRFARSQLFPCLANPAAESRGQNSGIAHAQRFP